MASEVYHSLEDQADEIEYPDGSDLCPRCQGDGTIPIILSDGTPDEITCPKCQGSG